MKANCRECTLFKPVNSERYCEICASRVKSESTGNIVYDAIIDPGTSIDYFPDSRSNDSFRLFFTSITKTYRVIIQEVPCAQYARKV